MLGEDMRWSNQFMRPIKDVSRVYRGMADGMYK